MNDIKVGDRVKSTYDNQPGIVRKISDRNTYQVEFADGGLLWCFRTSLKKDEHTDEIKVGDNIMVTSSNIGSAYDEQIGRVARIDKGSWPYAVTGTTYAGGPHLWVHGVKVPDNQDNVKVNGITYTELKPIYAQAVKEHGPCEQGYFDFIKEVTKFGYEFNDKLPLHKVMDICYAFHPAWIDWLISKGFIKKKEEEKFEVKVGDTFEYPPGYKTTLCRVGTYAIVAVHTDHPNYWNELLHGWKSEKVVRKIQNTNNVSKGEFKEIFGSSWETVYKTRNKL